MRIEAPASQWGSESVSRPVDNRSLANDLNTSFSDRIVADRHSDHGRTLRSRSSISERIVQSAIVCLDSVGYAATTTQRVIELAAVSRGAVLHYYPSKNDLMGGVAEYAVGEWIAVLDRAIDDVTSPGRTRFAALSGGLWDALHAPSSRALFEIMVARRGDLALAERVRFSLERLDAGMERAILLSLGDAARPDPGAITGIAKTCIASFCGLAFELRNRTELSGAAKRAWLDGVEMLLARSATGA